jgi:uncharacterized membrane protein
MAVTVEPRGQAATTQEPAREGDRRAPMLLAVVLVGAFVVRLLVTRALWLDETTTIAQAREPFGEMLAQLLAWDVHPPLFHVLMWAWIRLFGTGELAVRLPSIVAGVATVAIVYLLGRDLFTRRAGLLAAAATALAPMLVWYGQEARMYSLVLLFGLLTVWAQVRVLRSGQRRFWALYAIAAALLLWTHYFAVLYVALQQAAFLLVAWRRRFDPEARRYLQRWLAATAVIMLALAPMWLVLGPQLEAFQAREAGGGAADHPEALAVEFQGPLDTYAVGANGVWALWGFHPLQIMVLLVAAWPLLMLAGLGMLGRAGAPWKRFLAILVVLPPIALFLMGQQNRFVFEVRYFLLSVPLLLLLLASYIDDVRTRAGRAVASGLLLVPLAVGLVNQQTSEVNPRAYDFDDIIDEVRAAAGPDDLLVYEPWYLEETIAYYGEDLEAVPLRELDELPDRDDVETVFVVGSFLEQDRHASVHGAAISELESTRDLVWHTETPTVEARAFR